MIEQGQVIFDPITHTYFVGGQPVPGISQVLGAVGLKRLDGIPRASLERAASRGTDAHKVCELWDREELGEVRPDMRGYQLAWMNFRHDHGYDPDVVERPMVSGTWRYGGTPDRLAPWQAGDYDALVEIKTCALNDWVGWQLALQKVLVHENMPGRAVGKMIAVRIKADGRYEVREYRAADYPRDLALAAVALTNWQFNHGGLG